MTETPSLTNPVDDNGPATVTAAIETAKSDGRFARQVAPYIVTIGLFVLWEAACWLFKIPVYVMPKPSEFLPLLFTRADALTPHALQTLYTTLAGFGLAVIFGVAIGIAIGMSRLVYAGGYPLLVGFNSVPKVALVPIFVIWFGIGTVPAILTSLTIAIFPIVANVATGLATTQAELEDILRSLGASKWDTLVHVGLPSSLPYFFASLKIAISLAFVGTVVSETIAANTGIGALMMVASSNFDVPLVFAGLIILAIMGVALYALFAVIEERMTFWAQTRPGDA